VAMWVGVFFFLSFSACFFSINMTGETRLLFFLEKKNEAKEGIERDTAVMQPAFVLVGGHRLEPRGLDQGIVLQHILDSSPTHRAFAAAAAAAESS